MSPCYYHPYQFSLLKTKKGSNGSMTSSDNHQEHHCIGWVTSASHHFSPSHLSACMSGDCLFSHRAPWSPTRVYKGTGLVMMVRHRLTTMVLSSLYPAHYPSSFPTFFPSTTRINSTSSLPATLLVILSPSLSTCLGFDVRLCSLLFISVYVSKGAHSQERREKGWGPISPYATLVYQVKVCPIT